MLQDVARCCTSAKTFEFQGTQTEVSSERLLSYSCAMYRQSSCAVQPDNVHDIDSQHCARPGATLAPASGTARSSHAARAHTGRGLRLPWPSALRAYPCWCSCPLRLHASPPPWLSQQHPIPSAVRAAAHFAKMPSGCCAAGPSRPSDWNPDKCAALSGAELPRHHAGRRPPCQRWRSTRLALQSFSTRKRRPTTTPTTLRGLFTAWAKFKGLPRTLLSSGLSVNTSPAISCSCNDQPWQPQLVHA